MMSAHGLSTASVQAELLSLSQQQRSLSFKVWAKPKQIVIVDGAIVATDRRSHPFHSKVTWTLFRLRPLVAEAQLAVDERRVVDRLGIKNPDLVWGRSRCLPNPCSGLDFGFPRFFPSEIGLPT